MADDSRLAARRIILVGPMAAGKTTVGRQLARRLGLDFVDADQEIEARAGVDVATIFDFEGEAGFRRREHAILDELTQRKGLVIATGGGAILSEENRTLLRDRGLVVHLAVDVDEQLRRTRHDRSRPLLQQGDRRATLEQLAAERTPLYREVADLSVCSDGRRSRATVDRVIQALPAEFRNTQSGNDE